MRADFLRSHTSSATAAGDQDPRGLPIVHGAVNLRQLHSP